ncbi:type IV pilus modification protein PilV [Vreelandella andesensis]|uniref:Type IV pilus modification protein PilV n=1 Tax=Vreelandella andesensis TaxID=447567 RepID=A0A433KQX5_9GAMM|nr:type IV pilus modification protein PilV [Halomonas andesensis]RUR31995.1 type IV pilus modification protein PilV [Halomonas andesensis]
MPKPQHGISLLESLIALLVLSIGLLGVVGLQTQSLVHNRAAYFETQATNMAQDMLDRVRANPDQVAAYELNVGSTVLGSGLPANDQSEWVNDLASALPSGEGGIAINNRRVNVTVRWADASAPEKVRQIQLVSEL